MNTENNKKDENNMRDKTAHLTYGFLKDAFDKAVRSFESEKLLNVHKMAYMGNHPEISIGFAGSEFAGKYLDTCVNLYNASKNETILKYAGELAQCIADNQHENGYLGGYSHENEWAEFSVWNQAFSVYALVSYYNLTKNEEMLAAAVKCADNIIAHYETDGADILDGTNYGTQHLAFLITLPPLYKITKNKKYIDFMEYVFMKLSKSDNNFFGFESILELKSRKGIENFTVLTSMVMHYEITKNEKSLKWAEKYWDELNETQIRRTGNGTNAELWVKNANKPQFLPDSIQPNETCVAVGWMEFSMLLFLQTKETKYIDAIEKTLFNHILGSFNNDGTDFAYYQPSFGRRVVKTPNYMYKCCRYRGFNALSHLNDVLFYENENEIIPLVYANACYVSDSLKIVEQTGYPFSDTVIFKISGNSKKRFMLRVPEWCGRFDLRINGKECAKEAKDGYVVIDKINDKDVIIISFNSVVKQQKAVIDGKKYIGFSYGNVVLTLDTNLCDLKSVKAQESDEFKRNMETDYNIEFISLKNDLSLVDYASAAKQHEDDEYFEWIKED